VIMSKHILRFWVDHFFLSILLCQHQFSIYIIKFQILIVENFAWLYHPQSWNGLGRHDLKLQNRFFLEGQIYIYEKICKWIIKISYLEHVFPIEFFDPKGVSYKKIYNEQIGVPMACRRIITKFKCCHLFILIPSCHLFNVDFIKFSFWTFRYVIFKFVNKGALARPLKAISNWKILIVWIICKWNALVNSGCLLI